MKRACIRSGDRSALALSIPLFILSVTFYSCSIYDSDLTDNPADSVIDNAGKNADGGSNDGSVDDGAVLDTGVADVDGAINDGGEGDAQECVPNPDDDGTCPEICPEVCDGADNDCDGETDETEANASCALPNAVSQCVEGDCVFVDCREEYGDCDGDAVNGCETELDTLTDCGECDNECDGASCAGGVCTELECEQGFADCDAEPSNGCEASLGTVKNCAMCGNDCGFSNAYASCANRTCELLQCQIGFGNCDGDLSNGCEAELDTLTDCGACGQECPGESCTGGVCTELQCDPGYADCDEQEDNGCETPLDTLDDCGACSRSCVFDNMITACDRGRCEFIQCRPGFDDCDGDQLNGCETALDTLTDCGACGTKCVIASGEPSCAGGICTVANCGEGFADCDGDADNGCEASLRTLSDCGMCGEVCGPLDNATASCATGSCEIESCSAEFGDCDVQAWNGCETPLNMLDACGQCDQSCSLPHATFSCDTGSCQVVRCDDGYEDCDPDPGCETQLGTVNNCADCNDACPDPPNAYAGCNNHVCGIDRCHDNWGDCNGDPGCETQLGTLTNCSGCGDNCEALPNVNTADCSARECVITDCVGTNEDCDNDPDNGCEKNLATDVNNCNSCGYACPDLPYASEACVGGVCGIDQCDDNRDNCDGDQGNGCEVDLLTDGENCGGCDNDCDDPPNIASSLCDAGQCVITGCQGSYEDCDGDPSNGCEDNNAWPCFHYEPGNFDPTILNPGSAPNVTLGCDAVYNSSNPASFTSWCGQPAPLVELDTAPEPDVVILTFQNFTISSSGSLTIVGDKPVIFAVFGDAIINGDVEADASGSTPGPGGNIACGSGTGGNGESSDSDDDGAGGGGGGAFGDNGGEGGPGQTDDGGSRGTAVGNPELVPLRGGCAGGRGGRGKGSSGRYGGGGGGAFQISAARTLLISAVVSAAGGGGQEGSGLEDGGGGGGSGGGILLEGETVDIVSGAWVTANGGGGAEGASEDSGSAGSDGQNGYRASTANAQGGSGCSKCGDGGDGGSLTDTTGDNGYEGSHSGDEGGGGGGGGGVGRIRVNGNQSCSLAGTFSPSASTDC